MKTISREEAPEKFQRLIDHIGQREADTLPAAPPAETAAVRPFRAHYIPELGHQVYVTFADLNDTLFIAQYTPEEGSAAVRQLHGYILQVIACCYRVPEHKPQHRLWRVDRQQDDRHLLRQTLSWETLADICGISASLGRRREYVSEGVRDFLSATESCLRELSGTLSTSTDCPQRLKDTLLVLTSAARRLNSPTNSASGNGADAGG